MKIITEVVLMFLMGIIGISIPFGLYTMLNVNMNSPIISIESLKILIIIFIQGFLFRKLLK